MNNMIERYVQDVARRLPEKDREDVKKELRANIYDMLAGDESDEAVKKVLYQLGSPASLAEKYRSKPQYLISPAYYDQYVSVLKWVLPLVGVVVMVIGFATGAFDAVKAGTDNFFLAAGGIFAKGLSMGFSAAFHALFWTTVGFIIAERSREKVSKTGEYGWKIEELPEIRSEKAAIPLSDGVAGLILTVIFSALGLLFCTGALPFFMVFIDGDMALYNIFSVSFLALCVPAILVMLVLNVTENVAKIKDRRWSVFVCVSVVVRTLANMAITLYLINRPVIFSAEFLGFLSDAGILQIIPQVNGKSVLILVLTILVIIGTLSESITAVKKTVQSYVK